ncbi:acyl-CoA dehydrogenase [Iodidimonas muriae]|uniref:Acyl-CoA dehydrogenase n=1 Tax=Iodidimonas muriae TaxID=261467 RepID=A0ABQ2L8M8_9PROT|nr:acyl-CoA dehydrogenase [Iodidimonas muriae]GER06451.1 acyl-CoA dehydrogenase short-chain specific [Kordiimonadales bacterium JCM 17843]GGO04820.1 acyl-CoA dehydrogenase [Iodidimonas muriae]
MDFALSDEQTMLKSGAERFIRESYAFEKRRGLAALDEGFSRDHWRSFAELGWLALPFKEEDDGLGGSAVDVMLLMEQFGRGLVLEPYLSTILMAGGAISSMGSPSQRKRYLPAIMEGKTLAALAYVEPQGRYDLADINTKAEIDGKGWRLSGEKSVVLGGGSADVFVVLARTSGALRDERGLSCFLLERGMEGLTVRDYRTTDGNRAAELTFDAVALEPEALLGPEDGALPFINAVIDRATAAVCAEAVGIMDAAVEKTRAYLLQRKQFGQPLAAFQSLQHRLADMVIGLEQTRSLAYVASIRADGDDPVERARAVSAAKAEVARNGIFVVANAVQLHGGMGVSEELDIGTFFKRLHMINALFGDRIFHIRRHEELVA